MTETVFNLLDQIGALPTWSKMLMLAAVMPAAFTLLERLFPAHPAQQVPRRALLLNVTYWFINPLVIQIVSKLAVCLIGLAACAALGWPLDESVLDGFGPLGRQPLWLQTIEILVLADFVDYWTHRWFHVSRAWRFHAIHHSPEHMNWLASARMHPVNDFITRLCQVVPVVLVGLSAKAILIVVPVLVFFVIVLHSNLNWDYGPFRWVIVSPRYHRWHHTRDEEGLDKNFAGMFPLWDLLFGTAHFPKREPVQFGVNHDPPPETLLGQLAYPFRRLNTQHEEATGHEGSHLPGTAPPPPA
ncbi:sterol desaturase family protein [Gemmata sp. JC717]|uniref:Sterol desaturase family protein n=1 Tax=Gemmata algarum TaxID=2975278 RepID=A0ABU5F364_9BACT|nr:sterol desaturase family protein [Gemmata algarum]MDY3554729.1 sterol desaturase family protein [Gemmata algarum]MDY3561150.1 sterol desaturase family protein [Gemmata algarum]